MPRKPKEQIIGEFFLWNLFERDGVYYADGRGNEPVLGKHSLGTRDRDQALQNLRELDRRTAVQRRLIPADQATIPSAELAIEAGWERYFGHCRRPAALGGAGPRTLKRYRAVRDKHQSFCREKSIRHWNHIDKRSVEQYAAWLKAKGYSDATVYLEGTLIKQVVKWLIEEEKVLPESQRIRLRIRRSQESDAHCYSRDEVQAMIDLCRGRPELHWLADVMVALATTGMRIGELVDLRWSDIDLSTGMITLLDNRHSGRGAKVGAVRMLKGRYSRRLPIHPDLRQVLATLARRPDGRVFSGPRGGVLKPDTLRNLLIREVLTPLRTRFPTPKGEVGFEHGRLHSFRHSFVSQAFLGGASEGEIREWVGHTDSRIVERYRHLRAEDARRKMAGIRFLGGDGHDAASSMTHTTDGTNGATEKDKTVPAAAPGVPEPRQGQSSSAASATAQRKESKTNGEQDGSAGGGLSQ